MPEPTYVDQGARFSPDRRYRYTLWRIWDAARPPVAFILLNPSTADETELDPTLRRCLGFAQAWGAGGFWIGNVFAFRATDPSVMRQEMDPVGPENDAALLEIAARCPTLVCGWGVHAVHRGREQEVLRLLVKARFTALRLTKSGAPSHPLYLPSALTPMPWPSPKKEASRG